MQFVSICNIELLKRMTAILKVSFAVTCIAFPLLVVTQATRYWGKGEQYIVVRTHFHFFFQNKKTTENIMNSKIPVSSPINGCWQVCGREWISHDADHQEVSRCYIRGESQGMCSTYTSTIDE